MEPIDPRVKKSLDEMGEILADMRSRHDSRLVLSTLLGQAGVLAERLIAAKVKTTEEVAELYAVSFEVASSPRADIDPPQVRAAPEDSGPKSIH